MDFTFVDISSGSQVIFHDERYKSTLTTVAETCSLFGICFYFMLVVKLLYNFDREYYWERKQLRVNLTITITERITIPNENILTLGYSMNAV